MVVGFVFAIACCCFGIWLGHGWGYTEGVQAERTRQRHASRQEYRP